jgi:polyisoprenyl-phosphate glycosyltransferase
VEKHKEIISIVIPLFNEESNLSQLYLELQAVLNTLPYESELIFVDDGSKDKSFEVIKKLHENDPRVNCISFSRNFGHQIALVAGLEHSSGDIVISMDADLQHPPEFITELIKSYESGYDIVNTRRVSFKSESLFKKFSAWLFYKILNSLTDIRIEPHSADFRLMSRKVVDAFLKLSERDRFMRGLVSWVGFKQTVIDYVPSPRFAGTTKYTFKKMFGLGLNGVTSFSSKPLRVSFYIGLFVFIIGIFYAIYAIIQKFLGQAIVGWTSLLVTLLVIGGLQLLSLGIIGEYIARIFNEVKARPLYFIREKLTGRKE